MVLPRGGPAAMPMVREYVPSAAVRAVVRERTTTGRSQEISPVKVTVMGTFAGPRPRIATASMPCAIRASTVSAQVPVVAAGGGAGGGLAIGYACEIRASCSATDALTTRSLPLKYGGTSAAN